MINIPKGTKDVLPSEVYKWHYIEGEVRKVAGLFGYKEIRTPVFEHTELFLRGVGDTTDIVNKEMYTFLDKGDRSITLKPEGTAGAARSFIENALDNNPQPTKAYYITPVFRYEKPQAGRLREHHQFGVELYGSESPYADAEIITLAKSVFDNLGVTELELNINSIGCPNCRKDYSKALRDYFGDYRDRLCPTCLERLEKNPLRILDCKVEECKEIAKGAPVVLDYICDDCRAHHERLLGYLDALGVQYKVNPNIVRGLDYYTRTVFEFVSTAIGSQGTVCGGGRYNNLVEQLGGKPIPAVGFGMGIERLIMVLENSGLSVGDREISDLYVASFESTTTEAMKLVYSLRKAGVKADFDLIGRSLKAQMKFADKCDYPYVVVLGEDEVKKGVVTVKGMKDKTAEEVPFDGLSAYIRQKRK
ncbi:MAG: histidine--tRNA ligase [Clostridia bacterium]|nr:histidine--tRNA ligase [Clostridia bacterium]